MTTKNQTFHVLLSHQSFGVEGRNTFTGTLQAAKISLGKQQKSAGHGWTAQITDENFNEVAVRYPGESRWIKP